MREQDKLMENSNIFVNGDVGSILNGTLSNVDRTLKEILSHLSTLSELGRRVSEMSRIVHEMQIKAGMTILL